MNALTPAAPTVQHALVVNINGRSLLDAWCAGMGGDWATISSGTDRYRLVRGSSHVLCCYDNEDTISVFVEGLTAEEAQRIAHVGPSLNGYDAPRRGIRLALSPASLVSLLAWVRERYRE